MEDKHLYIISGPNGAGKTTASYSVLPKILHCKEFVNADDNQELVIRNSVLFNQIEEYVKRRT